MIVRHAASVKPIRTPPRLYPNNLAFLRQFIQISVYRRQRYPRHLPADCIENILCRRMVPRIGHNLVYPLLSGKHLAFFSAPGDNCHRLFSKIGIILIFEKVQSFFCASAFFFAPAIGLCRYAAGSAGFAPSGSARLRCLPVCRGKYGRLAALCSRPPGGGLRAYARHRHGYARPAVGMPTAGRGYAALFFAFCPLPHAHGSRPITRRRLPIARRTPKNRTIPALTTPILTIKLIRRVFAGDSRSKGVL